MFCKHCNTEIDCNAHFCPNCGEAVYQRSSKGGTAPMVLGIIALCIIPLGCFFTAFVLSILALVFSKHERKTSSRAKAGFIMGIIGLCLSSVFALFVLIMIVTCGTLAGISLPFLLFSLAL